MTFFTLILTAMAGEQAPDTFWLPPEASTLAGGVDDTFYFVYWVSAVFFFALMGSMFYFAIAYKKKSDDDRTLDLKGSHTIELAWSTLPSFLLIAMFVMGFQNYMKSTIPPADSVQVKVVGKKWDWEYTYPELGGFSSRDLVVPNQAPVRLQMVSMDVLHSYFIPDFRIKKDVLPNRYTTQWFETTGMYDPQHPVYSPNFNYSDFKQLEGSKILGTTEATDIIAKVVEQCKVEKELSPSIDCPTEASQVPVGLHQVFCTEYCGNSHSRMLSRVVVLEPEHFELWVKKMRNFDPYEEYETQAEVGKYLASNLGCAGCHSVDGSVLTGPSWKGLYGSERPMADGSTVVADDSYIQESVRVPSAKIVSGFGNAMNPFPADVVSEKDLSALIEYIKTLK